jgi:hypothetical protein
VVAVLGFAFAVAFFCNFVCFATGFFAVVVFFAAGFFAVVFAVGFFVIFAMIIFSSG